MTGTVSAALAASIATGALVVGALMVFPMAAKAGGVVTYPPSITGSYDLQTLDYIAAKGGMVTEIIGNPFNAPKAEVERVVNRILEQSHPGQDFPFFSQAPENFPSPYRVVVLLNQGTAYSGQRLCGESYIMRAQESPSAAGAQGPGRVEIAAAFCAREIYLTSVSGRASGIQSLQDRTFRKLLNQVGQELFPRRRLDRNGSGDVFF